MSIIDPLGDIVDNPALGIFWGQPDEETPDAYSVDPARTAPPASATESVAVAAAKGTRSMVVRVGTANVRNTPDLPRPTVVAAGRKVRDAFDVMGYQELGEKGQDRSDVLQGLGDNYGMSNAGPIDVQTQVAYLKSFATLLSQSYHMAVPGSQPYPNPARGWVYTVWNPKSGGFPFWVIDTHFVNRAWNDKPDAHKAIRKRNWDIHYTKLAPFVQAKARIMPGFIVGDFNRIAVQGFGKNFRWIGSGNATAIDKIGVALPAGYGAQVLNQRIIHDTPEEGHPCRITRVKLVKK